MSEKNPKDIPEYRQWLKEKRGVEISSRTSTHYDSVTSKMKSDLENSALWADLSGNLREYDDEYRANTGFPLTSPPNPEILVKPFDSFLLKTFRKNVLENKRWPGEPADGWILPGNWLSGVNDVLRTLIVVKYLDGVQFLSDKIKS